MYHGERSAAKQMTIHDELQFVESGSLDMHGAKSEAELTDRVPREQGHVESCNFPRHREVVQA